MTKIDVALIFQYENLKFKKYLVENCHNVTPIYHSTPGLLSMISVEIDYDLQSNFIDCI